MSLNVVPSLAGSAHSSEFGSTDSEFEDLDSTASDMKKKIEVKRIISELECIRDTTGTTMSLQEVSDTAAEIECLINSLMELGAYVENESLADAAIQPLIDRMMELAA